MCYFRVGARGFKVASRQGLPRFCLEEAANGGHKRPECLQSNSSTLNNVASLLRGSTQSTVPLAYRSHLSTWVHVLVALRLCAGRRLHSQVAS